MRIQGCCCCCICGVLLDGRKAKNRDSTQSKTGTKEIQFYFFVNLCSFRAVPVHVDAQIDTNNALRFCQCAFGASSVGTVLYSTPAWRSTE